MLAATLARLAEATGARGAAVWLRCEEGEPRSHATPGAPRGEHAPRREELAALAQLRGARDLGAPELAEPLHAVARAHDLCAAAPIGARGGAALGVLLLHGGAEDAPGAVRPRTLAALDAAARRLAAPAAAAEALERLARADAGMRRLDRLAALGELMAEIVHEVRNPLVSVKTFLQLLPERLEDREFLTRFLGVVADELRRIERLLDVVIEHGRPPLAGSPELPASLSTVLEAVAHLLRHRALERGVRLEVAALPTLPGVALHEDALRQVLLNLALNALEATASAGVVRLRARASVDGRGVEISVEDEGGGVPEALRERVFEPFFSTKTSRPGGIGLAISRRIAEQAGGSLDVSDAAGGGAVFTLRLPAL